MGGRTIHIPSITIFVAAIGGFFVGRLFGPIVISFILELIGNLFLSAASVMVNGVILLSTFAIVLLFIKRAMGTTLTFLISAVIGVVSLDFIPSLWQLITMVM